MVARVVRDDEAAGSNPVTPTIDKAPKYRGLELEYSFLLALGRVRG